MLIHHEIKPNLFHSGSAVALGFFDGVHLGHKEIIKKAVNFAKRNNLKSVVSTFLNHPHEEITGQAPKQLTTFEEKILLIESLEVDSVLALEFNSKLRHMSAQDYFSKTLVECLSSKYISVGYDHKFGFNQEGNPEKLKEWGKKFDIEVEINSPILINNEPVSSTRIRKNISAGSVKAANNLLGRVYALTGQVTQGLKRGTELGFPTANLMIPTNLTIPASGVYAGNAIFINDENKKFNCVINIGYCPTFKEHSGEVKIEAHILNFKYKELYKEKIKIEFIDRLRDEKKFNSKEELVEQIKKDCLEAEALISEV